MSSWLRELLSPNGDAERRHFWLCHIIVLVATLFFGLVAGLAAVILAGIFDMGGAKLWAPLVAACLAVAFAVYAECVVASKRGNARGWPRWLPIILLFTLGICNYFVGFGRYLHQDQPLDLLGVVSAVLLAMAWLWLFVELGLRAPKAKQHAQKTADQPMMRTVASTQSPVQSANVAAIRRLLPHLDIASAERLAKGTGLAKGTRLAKGASARRPMLGRRDGIDVRA